MFWVSLSFFEVLKNLSVTNLSNHWSMTINHRLELVPSTANVSELTNIHSFTAYQYCRIFVIWSENWYILYRRKYVCSKTLAIARFYASMSEGEQWVGDKRASWTNTTCGPVYMVYCSKLYLISYLPDSEESTQAQYNRMHTLYFCTSMSRCEQIHFTCAMMLAFILSWEREKDR